VAAWGIPGRWEIVIFQTATLQANGTYVLARFLRGLRGTEHAMDSHADSDYFVMLDADALRRAQMLVSEVGDSHYYKGVTVGRTLIETPAKAWVHNAVALMPWSPANVQSSVDGSDNIDITWDRRDRIISRALWDPPMSEDSESYKVEIMDGETVVNTLTSITETVEYSSADQVTDWGRNMAVLDIKVYQYSQALTDWGYPAEVRIGVPEDFYTAVMADSPEVYYRFDEASGSQVDDYSGNADHGTYEDDADDYEEPGGLLSDNNAAAYVGNNNAVWTADTFGHDGDVDVSYEFLFKMSTTSDGDQDLRFIADIGGAFGIYWNTSKTIKTYFYGSDSTSYYTDTLIPVAVEWFHVVLTFEDTSWKTYVDGELADDAAIPTSVTMNQRYSGANNHALGKRNWTGFKDAMEGLCTWSEFAAYDSVMTAATVKQRFYATRASLK